MATMNFHLRDKNAKSKTSIILQFNAGKKIVLSTGKSIPPKYWKPRTQTVNGSYTGGVEINLYLSKLQKDCLTEYERLIETNPQISFSELEAKLKDIVSGRKPSAAPDLIESYRQFLIEKAQEVKPLTMKKYNTLLKLLQEFAEVRKFNLNFDRINHSFDLAFRNYLIEDLKQVNDTISKYYDCLKVFLTWAHKQGIYKGESHKEFAAPRTKKDVIFLTEPELMTLFQLKGLSPKLERIRDTFCFQCFTGQRFSDIVALKWTDIKETAGHKEWHLYQIKGNKPKKVIIPLMPLAVSILSKYESDADGTKKKVLPTISNVKTNEYIKELCQIAKIEESTTIVQYSGKKRVETTKPKYSFISTHTARRTFVTLSLEKGMNPETIMEITGHEDYRTMRKYLKVTEKVKQSEMQKVWGASPLTKVS